MNLNSNHLKLGQRLYETLSEAVGNGNVYALRADPNTKLPLVLFARTGYIAEADEDHRHTEIISYDIEIKSHSYTESVDIATKVLDSLNDLQGQAPIESILIIDSEEDTEDTGNIYVQSLSIEIMTYY